MTEPQIDLGPHGSPIGRGVKILLIVIVLVAAVAAGSGVIGVFTQNAQQTSSNNAAAANQRNSHCLSVENVRWRQASSLFQAGTADLVAAGRDPAKVAAARVAISAARAELAAVQIDDARIDDPENPLCPYVAGDPGRTPNTPVNPTRPRG